MSHHPNGLTIWLLNKNIITIVLMNVTRFFEEQYLKIKNYLLKNSCNAIFTLLCAALKINNIKSNNEWTCLLFFCFCKILNFNYLFVNSNVLNTSERKKTHVNMSQVYIGSHVNWFIFTTKYLIKMLHGYLNVSTFQLCCLYEYHIVWMLLIFFDFPLIYC